MKKGSDNWDFKGLKELTEQKDVEEPKIKKKSKWGDPAVPTSNLPSTQVIVANPQQSPVQASFLKTQSSSGGLKLQSPTSAKLQPPQISPKQSQKEEQVPMITIEIGDVKPDDLNVGQLVEIFKLKQKKLKEYQIEGSLMYVPFEETDIPIKFDIPEKSEEYLKTRVDQFYKFLEEEREVERKLKKKKEKEMEREFEEFEKMKEERERKSSTELNQKNYMKGDMNQTEMGVRADGQAFSGGTQIGLGYEEKRFQDENAFTKFRKQQSYFYHQTAEERSQVREKIELCYKCNMPGHIARDCKYGLT